ncbi:hypothetical protein MNBD_GAMMA07-383 [hydrothermal vent metagenome]|uniref:DUF4124 domain-containing protein n=1 Tax=hydrothermal vent metagenome TaxID=652676 RepID=A0A3B0X082_9ZZZZ
MLKKSINVIFLLIYMFAITANAEIYKWVDAQGKIHYGDKINSDSTEKVTPIDVDTSIKGNLQVDRVRTEKRRKLLNAFSEDRVRENKQKAKAKKLNKKKARACIRYKDKMRRYNRASSLYRLDKTGNRVTMSNEEREKSTESLKNKIKKHCK